MDMDLHCSTTVVDGFYPWIVPSQTEYPDESSLLYDETTGHFSYSIGFEDYLYSPCE